MVRDGVLDHLQQLHGTVGRFDAHLVKQLHCERMYKAVIIL